MHNAKLFLRTVLFLLIAAVLAFAFTGCLDSLLAGEADSTASEDGSQEKAEDQPQKQEDPDTPDEPDEPDEPDTPDEPDEPDEPDTPDEPEEPEEPVHEHTFSELWSFDENNHWHIATCEHSSEISDLASHTYGENYICTVCGYDATPEEPPVEVSITYIPENGDENTTVSIMSNVTPAVPQDPVKIGYTLLGWFAEGSDTAFDFTKPIGKESVTLTARWGEAYTYEENENGIILTAFVGHETEILLPHELYGKTVVSFGTVFAGKDITSIDIAEGYTEVEDYAFADCKLLKNVILPATMTKFGKSAFSGCEVIRKFVIPKAVSVIGSQCFAGCKIILIYANVSGKQNGWAYDWNPLNRQVNYDVSDNLLPIHYF